MEIEAGGPPWSGPEVAGTVTVSPGVTAGHIGAGFAGLSYEKSHLTDGFFTGDNAPLIALFNLLGPSVLRIGGNSADETTWQPTATPVAPATISPECGTASVDALGAFIEATHWKVLYGVNLKAVGEEADGGTSAVASAAAEATYAATTLGGNLYGFEIGNEVDVYEPSYAVFKPQWESVATAIRGSAGASTPLTGPAVTSGGVWFLTPFAKDEASEVNLLTQHYYRGDGHASSSTMAELLAPDPDLGPLINAGVALAKSNGLAGGYRLAETNSFYDHGAPGVSDALGSALWALDFLFTNAIHGSSGVNFHGGGAGQDGPTPFLYTPIAEEAGVVTGAQPILLRDAPLLARRHRRRARHQGGGHERQFHRVCGPGRSGDPDRPGEQGRDACGPRLRRRGCGDLDGARHLLAGHVAFGDERSHPGRSGHFPRRCVVAGSAVGPAGLGADGDGRGPACERRARLGEVGDAARRPGGGRRATLRSPGGYCHWTSST